MTSEGATSKLQVKNLWVKNVQFKRRHRKTAAEKPVGEKIFSSEGAIPKLQVKNPEIKYHPKTADENSCVSKVPLQNWRPNTEPPNATGCPPLFQKVQNPDPNKLHNASKSCSRQQTSTKKAEEPNSAKTHK